MGASARVMRHCRQTIGRLDVRVDVMWVRDRALQAADRALQPDVRASDQGCRVDRPGRSGGST
jgi:hypothetical protein